MGTNFYIETGREVPCVCPDCGHEHTKLERLHIGKSSFGRYFTLQGDRSRELVDLKSWKAFLEKTLAESKDAKIVDEYGDQLSLEDMVHCITRDTWGTRFGDFKKGDMANDYGDVYGEKGLVYFRERGVHLGEDGLYVVVFEDFS